MPFLGALPDGIVSCQSCRKGVIEVKCPFSTKDGLKCPFSTKDGLPDPPPEKKIMCKQDGKLMLKKEHAYYYQVQMQLALCKLAYCDFVMWTNKDLAVERISADEHFFRSRLDNLQHFFVYGIMPEIVGKWYSRKPITNAEGIVPQTVTHASSNTDVQESNKTVVLLQYVQLWKYGYV